MSRWIAGAVTLALALTVASVATAQSRTFTQEQQKATGTIVALDANGRLMTVRKTDGNHVDIMVPQEIKQFSNLRVGDVINATYYQNVVVRLKRPGEPDVDTGTVTKTPVAGGQAGTAARQRTITGTITRIDLTVPAVTITGPNNWQYTSPVEDVATLKRVKLGEKVEITWTDALLLSVTPGK